MRSQALVVELVIRFGVADFLNYLPDHVGYLDVCLGGDLSQNDHQADSDGHLAGDPGFGVILNHGIEYAVSDLVAQLVGVAFRNRFGSKEVFG